MEKAILKTLHYANIFSYPLKGYEVYKWLVKKETTLLKVEKALNKLIKKKKVQIFKGYYFLPRKKGYVFSRVKCEKYSEKLFLKAIFFANILRLIPWIKLIGISGGLALNNASKRDDIDFFIITSKNRLWVSRFLSILILDLFNVRRRVGMNSNLAKRKICLNTILDEDNLEQKLNDLYTAHEVLQMKVLWQREGIYSKFLSDNEWTFKFLPNWSSKIKYLKPEKKGVFKILNIMEDLAKSLQLKVMKKPKGLEKVEQGALYFHPIDYRGIILKEYTRKTAKL